MRPVVRDGVAWSVGLSVAARMSVWHDREPCKIRWTDRNLDSVGSRDACRPIRWECTLAPRGEYDWTVHVRRRRGLFVKLLWPFVIIDVVVSIGLHDLKNKKSALGPDRHRLVGLVNKMSYKWAFSDSIRLGPFLWNFLSTMWKFCHQMQILQSTCFDHEDWF